MREMKDSGIEWIGEIPKEWGITEIKHYCIDVFAGGTPQSTNFDYWDGDIKWIPSGSCHDCKIYSAPKTITKMGYENSSTKLIPANTALVAMTGATCGNTGFLTFESCANQSVTAYVANTKIADSLFLWYLLQSAKAHLLTFQTGGAQGGINVENCKNIVVPFVPILEQQKISFYLDTKCTKIDSIIEKQERIIEKLKEYKLSKINEIVTDVDGDCCHLGHISLMKNGLNFNLSPNGNKVKFLGVGDFKDYFVLNDKSMFSDIIIDDEIPDDYLLQNGDIIFVRSNGSKDLVGRAVMVENIDYKLTYSGFCIKFRNTRDDLINDKYLLYFFRSPYFRKQLEKYSQGSNISNINQVLLSHISIIIPSLSYQNTALKKLDKLSLCVDSAIEKSGYHFETASTCVDFNTGDVL